MNPLAHCKYGVLLGFLIHATVVHSSTLFWTVTSNFQYSMNTSLYTGYRTPTLQTYTVTRTMSKGVTPTASAASTSRDIQSLFDLEIVSIFYPINAVAESQLLPTSTSTTSTMDTVFYLPMTYTAPASCSKGFTWPTSVNVRPPSAVIDQITPTSVKTYPLSSSSIYPLTKTVTWYLSNSAVPYTTTTDYYYRYYVANCKKPDYVDDSDLKVCTVYTGCTSFRTWIIVIASILPALFVLGFLESWFWFRRLMTGQWALRFGTCCWISISLWVLCFTRRQSARSDADQQLLREQWRSMSFGSAFKLWLKWGFRHSYPTSALGVYSKETVGIVRPGEEVSNAGGKSEQPLPLDQGHSEIAPIGSKV